MFADTEKKIKPPRKITKQRLKNIALYYLKRFESSSENLRSVLRRRVDKYAFAVAEFNKAEAYAWVDETVAECENLNYVNDDRFAEFKIKSYINSGKSQRYIQGKLKQKGIDENVVENILEEQEYQPFEVALKFAKKKKIGPFRQNEEQRVEYKQKDMMKLVQAGFDYETVSEVMDYQLAEDE